MAKKAKNALLPKITSLFDLRRRAGTDPRYVRLAVVAANNLGGNVKDGDFNAAMRWLNTNATEAGDESGEMIVAEINDVRDLI